jgi:hypothetical protein
VEGVAPELKLSDALIASSYKHIVQYLFVVIDKLIRHIHRDVLTGGSSVQVDCASDVSPRSLHTCGARLTRRSIVPVAFIIINDHHSMAESNRTAVEIDAHSGGKRILVGFTGSRRQAKSRLSPPLRTLTNAILISRRENSIDICFGNQNAYLAE